MALTISVVIPALHEQERINGLIEHLKGPGVGGQEPDGCFAHQIIVVDGDSEGSTIAVISDRAVRCLTAPKGRGIQLAAGVGISTGDIILMLHADTLLPEDWSGAIMDAVNNGTHWGAFRLGIWKMLSCAEGLTHLASGFRCSQQGYRHQPGAGRKMESYCEPSETGGCFSVFLQGDLLRYWKRSTSES